MKILLLNPDLVNISKRHPNVISKIHKMNSLVMLIKSHQAYLIIFLKHSFHSNLLRLIPKIILQSLY